MPRDRSSLETLGWLAAAGLVLLLALIPRRSEHFPLDYYQWWVTGQALRALPVTDIYAPEQIDDVAAEFVRRADALSADPDRRAFAAQRKNLYVTGTPLLIALVTATSTGDFDADFRRFEIAGALLFGLGFLAFAAALRVFWPVALALLSVWTLLAWPYATNARFGSVSALHAGAFLGTLALTRIRGRSVVVAVGFLLAALAAFKPTLLYAPLLLLIGMASARRWRDALASLAGMAAALAVALALPAAILGPACSWRSWAREAPKALLQGWWLTGGFLGKLGVDSVLAAQLLVLALLAVAAALLIRTGVSAEANGSRDATAAAAGGLVYLLAAPIVHSHYFLQAAPAVLIAFRRGPGRRLRWLLGAVALFLLAAHPLFERAGLTRWPNHSLWTFAGAYLAFGLVLWELHESNSKTT